jgi:hypothetical protein
MFLLPLAAQCGWLQPGAPPQLAVAHLNGAKNTMPWFIVGANHGNSDFTVSVERGEHHACVTLHSSLVARRVELAHFTAEADKVYYYCTQLVMSRSVELLELEPVDSDQGKHLVASVPRSVSSPKR